MNFGDPLPDRDQAMAPGKETNDLCGERVSLSMPLAVHITYHEPVDAVFQTTYKQPFFRPLFKSLTEYPCQPAGGLASGLSDRNMPTSIILSETFLSAHGTT